MSHTREHGLPILTLTESQVRRLGRLWFVYGNNGPKHTAGNHKFIQRFFDAQQDQRRFYSAQGLSKECIEAVEEVIGPAMAKHKCVRDPNGSGREWLYRGFALNDQSGSGVSPAYRWKVINPSSPYAHHFRTKAEAIKRIDKWANEQNVTK